MDYAIREPSHCEPRITFDPADLTPRDTAHSSEDLAAAHGPFLANAEVDHEAGHITFTSPILITAQAIPPRCRKPRKVQYIGTMQARLPICDDGLEPVIDIARTNRFSAHVPTIEDRYIATTDGNSMFSTQVGADTIPTVAQLEASPEDRIIFANWPSMGNDRPAALAKTITIQLPTQLDNGRPNPLAVFASRGFLGLDEIDVTGLTAAYPTRNGRWDVQETDYIESWEDTLPVISFNLDMLARNIIAWNGHLYCSQSAPAAAFRNTSTLPIIIHDSGIPSAVSLADPAIHQSLQIRCGIEITVHNADHLPGQPLDKVVQNLTARLKDKHNELLNLVLNPADLAFEDGDPRRQHVPGSDPREQELTATIESLLSPNWEGDVYSILEEVKEAAHLCQTARNILRVAP